MLVSIFTVVDGERVEDSVSIVVTEAELDKLLEAALVLVSIVGANEWVDDSVSKAVVMEAKLEELLEKELISVTSVEGQELTFWVGDLDDSMLVNSV